MYLSILWIPNLRWSNLWLQWSFLKSVNCESWIWFAFPNEATLMFQFAQIILKSNLISIQISNSISYLGSNSETVFLCFFSSLFQDLKLWNKRPTKILIVHKQSHPMQRRELNTNFSTKELKQTKTDGMAWNYLGQILKEKYCYKVLPQSRWHVAVDSVVNWCHFELLSSFLEMRIPPYIQTYNKMESNISGNK